MTNSAIPNFETITDADLCDGDEAFQPQLDEARAALDNEDKIRKIRNALADYHFALDTRRHGNIAMHNFVDRVEKILGACWEDGAEKKRRSGK